MKWETIFWSWDYWPSHGEKRITKKFAWYPVYLDNGFTIWLEFYFEEEKYTSNSAMPGWITEKLYQ